MLPPVRRSRRWARDRRRSTCRRTERSGRGRDRGARSAVRTSGGDDRAGHRCGAGACHRRGLRDSRPAGRGSSLPSRAGWCRSSRCTTSFDGRSASVLAACLVRDLNAGCSRATAHSTGVGGGLRGGLSAPIRGRRRVYMNPLTKRCSRHSAGTPISANTRVKPRRPPSLISDCHDRCRPAGEMGAVECPLTWPWRDEHHLTRCRFHVPLRSGGATLAATTGQPCILAIMWSSTWVCSA